MFFNFVLATMAAVALWNAQWVHATASRVYRDLPLAFFPEVQRAIRNRVVVASALLLWCAYRVWG